MVLPPCYWGGGFGFLPLFSIYISANATPCQAFAWHRPAYAAGLFANKEKEANLYAAQLFNSNRKLTDNPHCQTIKPIEVDDHHKDRHSDFQCINIHKQTQH